MKAAQESKVELIMFSVPQVSPLNLQAKSARLSLAFHRPFEALSNKLGPSPGLDSAGLSWNVRNDL